MEEKQEIEKKFLLEWNAPLTKVAQNATSHAAIEQGYLVSTPEVEQRIRMKDATRFMTVKSDGDAVRNEWEIAIPEWTYSTLKKVIIGELITKTRYVVPCPVVGLNFEIDEFTGPLKGLVLLECEFPSVEVFEQFVWPQAYGEGVLGIQRVTDVTRVKLFKNKNIALMMGDVLGFARSQPLTIQS